MGRPPIAETCMTIAREWAKRSTCPRGAVGCVAVGVDGRMLASGYNGAPRGLPHCDRLGCIMDGGHCVRALHGEANLIITAGRYGAPLSGSTVYTTLRPCLRCTMMLIQAGVAAIVFEHDYESDDAQLAFQFCVAARVSITQWTGA